MDMLLSAQNYFAINPFLIDVKIGPKKDRREYFKSYYKNLRDERKVELRKKKRDMFCSMYGWYRAASYILSRVNPFPQKAY